MKIHTLPPDIRYEGKSMSYSATYVREGTSVKVERRAVKNYGKSVCGPSGWEELKAYQAAIRLDLRAQFVY